MIMVAVELMNYQHEYVTQSNNKAVDSRANVGHCQCQVILEIHVLSIKFLLDAKCCFLIKVIKTKLSH